MARAHARKIDAILVTQQSRIGRGSATA